MTSIAQSEQPGVDIRRYSDILAARWRFIAAFALLGALAAGAYLFLMPATYTASTTLSVYPITNDRYAANRNISNLVEMDAEAVVASSFTVAQAAAAETNGLWEAKDLRTATTATAGAGSTTMMIKVEASSEAKARAGAGAMAEAYLQIRSDQAADSISAVLEEDRQRINEHRQQLTEALERLAAAKPGSLEAAEAGADQQILNLQVSSLLTRIGSLEGIDTTGGLILNPSSMTDVVVDPPRRLTLAAGLAAGLLLGIVAAFATHSRRRHVWSWHDISRELEVDTLGELDQEISDEGAIAVSVQRLLRQVTLQNAERVAFLFDGEVRNSSDLMGRIAAEIERSGGAVVLADPDSGASPASAALTLSVVEPGASSAERLQAMRTNDAVVVVAIAGKTRLMSLRKMRQESAEMGASILGTLLIGRKARSGGHSK